MSAKYELWLTDDKGQRLTLLENVAYFSYAKTVSGFSNITVGLGFDNWIKEVPTVFRPDWRIDVWRSPMEGVPARREKSFLLRKYIVSQRLDGVRIIELFGRDAKDILRRQYISSFPAGGRTDEIDDAMKYIVTNSILGTATVPTGEFVVDGNSSDGPIVTADYDKRNVLDALNDLNDISQTLNLVSSANKVIYFDVVEDDSLVTGGFGYRFSTYATIRGIDRTAGLLFSPENGNIADPSYFEDHLDAFTIYDFFNEDYPTANATAQVDDQYLSRWNYTRNGQSTSDVVTALNLHAAYAELQKARRKKVMNVTFVNSPGARDQPRSLYGLDWDLGDLLPVKFAGQVFNAEVKVIYVSVNDKGEETLTGRSTIGV